MAGLKTIRLSTKTPCCGDRVVFKALEDVPYERYDRTCKSCGRVWTVLRKGIVPNRSTRYDRLDWETVGLS